MKTAISILLLTTMILTFSPEAKSQNTPELRPPAWVGTPVGSTKEGASQELMNEFSAIVSKYGDTGEQWWIKFEKNITVTDKNRLEQIFRKMSAEQQAKQKIAFIRPPQPLKKIVPTQKEFNAWKNETVYGVWVNGKKVSNSSLNDYSHTDFEQATVSKLYGAAKQNKKYSYQVDLMTKDYYRSYYQKAMAHSGTRMVFKS